MSEEVKPKERRAKPFDPSEAKFKSQYIITLCVLGLFGCVNLGVFFVADESLRTAMVQADIGLMLMAAGFWFGQSKSAADPTPKE